MSWRFFPSPGLYALSTASLSAQATWPGAAATVWHTVFSAPGSLSAVSSPLTPSGLSATTTNTALPLPAAVCVTTSPCVRSIPELASCVRAFASPAFAAANPLATSCAPKSPTSVCTGPS